MEQLVKAIINQHHEVDMLTDAELDIVKKPDANTYHVLHQGKSYHVNLVSVDRGTKTVKFTVNDVIYEVSYMDEVDVIVDEMGLTAATEGEVVDAVAPMPGLVLKVLVAADDVVEEGASLLILEAMKMENVIKAAHAGVIKELLVQNGDKVEKGQVLVSYVD